MIRNRHKNTFEIIFISGFLLASLVFFGFFYQYHLYFTEQLQIFLFTGDHFLSYFSKPAFLSSFLGDFFTQFYYLIGGGTIVITSSLLILWLTVRKLIRMISGNNAPELLSVIPVIFSWIAICDINFPLSNIISLIISVGITLIYISIRSFRVRLFCGVIMLPLLYAAAGSNFYFLAVFAIYFEAFNTSKTGKLWYGLILALFTLLIPFILKNIYLITTGQAYSYLSEMQPNQAFKNFIPLISLAITVFITRLPFEKLKSNFASPISLIIQSLTVTVILFSGILLNAGFALEKILRLDREASYNNWTKVYALSQKYKMHNNVSAYYTNMALSRLDLMPDKLMENYQPAATGLFIPVNANENYMTITFSNEVYWQLGEVNASQHSALLGMIFSPRGRNVRLMKRLVEINIVNGEYAVAGKFIAILEKTLFYRKWASEKRKFLYNEVECAGSEWIMAKRVIIPSADVLKKGNEYKKTLEMLAYDHPENRMAVDYLLCYDLLDKNITSFVKNLEVFYKSDDRIVLPTVYQEALLITIASGKHKPEDFKQYIFNPENIRRIAGFTRIYEENLGKGEYLQKDFGNSYWFYFHFATLKPE